MRVLRRGRDRGLGRGVIREETRHGTSNDRDRHKLAWIELSSKDPAASRDFYSRLFGWHVEVSPDPQYGGYGMAKVDGDDVAGIGPSQSPEAPTAWGLYIGSAGRRRPREARRSRRRHRRRRALRRR